MTGAKHYCCSPDCPGLPYKASELAHPPDCGQQQADYRRRGLEALSCPFCEQTGAVARPIQSGLRWLCGVECPHCGAVGPVKFSFARDEARAAAVRAWNRAHGERGEQLPLPCDHCHGEDCGGECLES